MSKVNLGHHYSIHDCPDGSKTIRVLDTVDGEPIEFECINGNIIISGDMSFDYDDVERCEITLAKCIQYGKEFLMEWLIHEEIADAIIKDLIPWFEKYAISEEDAILNEITNLESWIDGRRNTIADLMKRNDMHRMTIAEQNRKINENVDRVLAINTDIEKLEEKITTLKSQLKGA